MTKTLKDLFEVYKPKSPDEQKFVDKHVTIKHKDRNGNEDDVFKGNTKYIKRKEERHGYDVGDDEKVYEEVEEIDEQFSPGDKVKHYKTGKTGVVHDQLDWSTGKKSYMVKWKGSRSAKEHWPKELVKEDVEEIEELSQKMVRAYRDKARDDKESAEDDRQYWKAHDDNTDAEDKKIRKRSAGIAMATKKLYGWPKVGVKEEAELEEKKLTPAEMRKREEIAKAMERENPGMDKSKKMAIATATAKRVAEEAEELDELSNKKMSDYMDKASDARGHRNLSTKKVDNRYKGVAMAAKKMAKEEVEQVDELSKGTLGSYVNKAAERIGTQGVTAGLKIASDENSKKNFKNMGKRQKGIATAMKKLTKEEIIDRAINKYMPELEDYVPMTQEEKLVAKLEHLPEAHVLTLLGLYENLNEDNRNKMMIAIDTQEGINSLIDFAIQNNRGE